MPENLPCKIRRSRRAKNILLRVTPEDGLVATLPWRASQKALRQALAEHSDWIEQQLLRIRPLQEQMHKALTRLPDVLELRATGESLQLHYLPAAGKRRRIIECESSLHVHTKDTRDIEAIHHQLGDFVRRRARKFLGNRLEQLASHHQLSYSGLSIRRQKTRWGSCSAKQHINLNDRLLFLPEPLMEHVLLHELAHTRHLDHSTRFYALLQAMDPDAEKHRRELRQAGQYVPFWL